MTTGQVLEKSVGLRRTLEAVKDAYYGARREGKAVGIACGLKNSGIGNGVAEWGKCRLVVERDGTVSLYNGYTEMGQGLLTVLVQFAVEVTGPPRVRLPSEGRLDLRPRLRPDDRLPGDPLRRRRGHERGPQAPQPTSTRAFASPPLAGRVYAADEVIDDTTRARRGGAEGQDAHVLRIRHAGRDPGRRTAASSTWWPRTTWAGS